MIRSNVWRTMAGMTLALGAAAACSGADKATPEETKAAATPAAAPPPAAPTYDETSPDSYRVKFTTSKGDFVVEVTRSMSPAGSDRFYTLVDSGYFKDIRFFRVVPNFVVQFGMHGDPATNRRWQERRLNDEPVKGSNTRGWLVYAKQDMPNTRSNQFFINIADNTFLDAMGFSPFGHVVEGMPVVDKLYSGYGEETTSRQGEIAAQGNEYLNKNFPKLDYIKSATIVK